MQKKTNQCPITKKKGVVGGTYSNRVRATRFKPTGKHKKNVNLQKKNIFVPELGKKVKIKVSTAGLRTLKKKGIHKTLRKSGVVK